MKKLSLIAGLACLATVGGVFGAWVFGSDAARTATAEQTATITVDSEVNASAAISAVVSGAQLSLHFDQSADNSLKPIGEATVTNDGAYTVTITDGSSLDNYNSTYAITGVKFVVGANDLGIDTETELTCDDTPSASLSRSFTLDTAEVNAALDNMSDIGGSTPAAVAAFNTAVQALSYKLVFTVEVTRTPKA